MFPPVNLQANKTLFPFVSVRSAPSSLLPCGHSGVSRVFLSRNKVMLQVSRKNIEVASQSSSRSTNPGGEVLCSRIVDLINYQVL